jgi:hypothetical protein
MSCTQYLTDKQDTVIPTIEEAVFAACIILVSYLAYLFDREDGSDMFFRNIG